MTQKAAALRRSLSGVGQINKDMLRYVLDQGRDCIKILSADGRVEYVNSEGQCALSITDMAKVKGRFWPDLWPEESRECVRAAVTKAAAGEGSAFEAWRPDPGGSQTWWQISVSPLLEEDGELSGILTISRDVTEFVRLRQAERTLALEMKHRLRNAYAVASAIVSQSARGNAEHRKFGETVTARLADVALSQARLLEAGEKSWKLADLVGTLVEAHGSGAEGVRYTGTVGSQVNGHEAMLIALVVGELTNNSLKYGALGQGNQLKLSWSDGDHLRLRWREPLSRPLASPLGARDQGSGYSLMGRMARSQRAEFLFEADDRELRAELILPRSA